jgi:cob(I)alamin adenosyltransferase
MPRLTTIYTRKGDEGETSLGGGQRVPKNSARVAAYGTVDELNSAIGAALAHGLSPRLMETLPIIQNELFHLGSDLAFREEDKQTHPLPQIEERHVQRLEEWIDELNGVVGPLQNFILPGGSIGAAQLHAARTICRRAERDVLTLAREEPIGARVMPYLNRLSDLLFVMARYENRQRGSVERLWNSRI